ncbi:hypothetical protein MMRN_58190 [Mycobacterium marinum]|nr:hypothetical protein MMRN_58190 [Mycobacterium marinum]
MALTARQRDIQLAAMPPLVDGVEFRDGLVITAVFQLADLYLVNADHLVGRDGQFGGDHLGRLRRPSSDRVHQHGGTNQTAAREGLCLLPARRVNSAPGGSVSKRRSTLLTD